MSVNPYDRGQASVTMRAFEFVQAVGKVTASTILGVTLLGSSVVAGGLVGLAISFRNLPDVRVLRDYVPTETSHIYDINGDLLFSIHDEANREVVPLDRISDNLKLAVLGIEDSHFYIHQGINPSAIFRAVLANMTAGQTVEGASTLTMQLVKNLFLTPKRELSRKVAEAVLAIEMGADAHDIGLSIHAHPTLSETVCFAAEMKEGTITDLYIKKR